MDDTRTGLLAAGAALLGIAVNAIPAVALTWMTHDGLRPWVPTVGTLGQTIVVYRSVFEVVGPS